MSISRKEGRGPHPLKGLPDMGDVMDDRTTTFRVLLKKITNVDQKQCPYKQKIQKKTTKSQLMFHIKVIFFLTKWFL